MPVGDGGAGRTQNVARVPQAHAQIADLKGVCVVEGLDLRQHAPRVLLRVEGQRGLVLGEALLVGVARVFFLDVSGVGQQDAAEVARGGGGVDRRFEAIPDHHGQVSRMVQVGVREDHGVEAIGRHRRALPVAQPQLLEALVEAAVDEEPCAGCLD